VNAAPKLDDLLPEWNFGETHAIDVAAPPQVALDAARHLAPRDSWLFIGLMTVRELPAILLRRFPRLDLDMPIVDQARELGFALVADGPDALVLCAVGRFWRFDSGLRPIATEREFLDFDEPGYAKVAFDFRAAPAPRGARLSTETRIAATDPAARRTFGRYWRVIYPGSAAIRMSLLRAVRRRAERR
jgi:hypothetical protein